MRKSLIFIIKKVCSFKVLSSVLIRSCYKQGKVKYIVCDTRTRLQTHSPC